jgi:hypothetical protein
MKKRLVVAGFSSMDGTGSYLGPEPITWTQMRKLGLNQTARAIIALAAFLLSGCTPELKVEENSNLLAREMLVGVNCGDLWETVKKAHDSRLTVFEKTFSDGKSLFQLRRGDPESNGFYVGFGLDEEKRVVGMDFELHGEEKNQVRARAIQAALTMHFTAKTGKPPADRVSFTSFTPADPFPWIYLHGNQLTDLPMYVVHGAVACR